MPITRAQKSAAAHSKGHALVLAGPGTGKTATLIERCRLLVRAGVPLDGMFVSTFTAKAASEIRTRLKTALVQSSPSAVDPEEVLKNAHIGTFHSLCARLLKRFPMDVGLPYDFDIIGDEDQRQILYDLGVEWDEDDGSIPDLISRWKDCGSSPEKALEEAKMLGDKFTVSAAKAYAQYEAARREKASVDFSDLITLATDILEAKGPGAKWFHGNFMHFVVDEFQDTNRTQIDFLKSALGRHGKLWAVGDENQSLYEWRGSSPEYCLNFRKNFPGAKLYQLNEGFRCSPLIVEMSTKLISANESRYDKEMRPARKGKDGEFVLFKGCANDEQEARWITSQLKKLSERGGKLSSTAVLFRTSSAGSTIQRTLETTGIPFRLTGTGSFWSLPEVKLFTTAVADVCEDGRFDVRGGYGRTKAGFKVRALAEHLRGEPARVVAQPMAQVLFDYRPRKLDAERKSSWMANVQAASNMLLDYDDASGFLDRVEKSQREEAEVKGDRVTLSTLHSAKGLEWDMVFVAGCESDLMPHAKSTNTEEERRLFYVGMTRARHRLIMSYAYQRNDKAKSPSPFLKEAVLKGDGSASGFKWSDPRPDETRDKAGKDAAKDKSTTTYGGKGKTFRYKGGRSLIPPEERES